MSAAFKSRSRAYLNATNKNWQSGKTLMFVKMYKHHSCLWDHSNSMYKNQSVRSAAYQAMADQFDMTVGDVKSKIKNLRATYFQEIKKINDPKYNDDEGGTYKPTLVWFDEMGSFIKAGPGSSLSSVSVIKSPSMEDKDSNGIEDSLLEDSIVVKDEPLLDLSDSESTTTSTFFQQPSPQVDHPYQTTSKKPKTRPSRIPPASSSTVVYDLNSDQSPFNSDAPDFLDDEFDVFGKHVACQLRQLGIYRALKVQAKIQLMLSRERARDVQEKSKNQQQQQTISSAGSVAGGSEHSSGFGNVEQGGASGVGSIASGLNSPDTNRILFQPVDDAALEEFAQL